MQEWIDLNDAHSADTRELARTLCEARIARGRKRPIGDSAQSKPRAMYSRVFTSAWLTAAGACALATLGGAMLGAVAVLSAMGARP